MSTKMSTSAFHGACILSAVGSLPHHIMPLLVASAILAERVTPAQAGVLAGIYLTGQLLITTLLPLLSVRFLRGSSATKVCVALVAVIFLSCQASGTMFYANWFLIGVCCGLLSYLGSTSAAAMENKSIAFAVRLGVTLLVAGSSMLVFYNVDEFAGFTRLVCLLATIVALLSCVGIWYYNAPLQTSKKQVRLQLNSIMFRNTHWGLFYLFLFVGAQVGFIVFAIDLATQRGIKIEEAVLAFAVCKIIAALFLFALHGNRQNIWRAQYGILNILTLLVGCILVATSESVLLFMLGILLWEICVNLSSSRFQASVVEVNPAVGGMLLTITLLLGSALGPMINGALISADSHEVFYFLVALSVFLPMVWQYHRQTGTSAETSKSKCAMKRAP